MCTVCGLVTQVRIRVHMCTVCGLVTQVHIRVHMCTVCWLVTQVGTYQGTHVYSLRVSYVGRYVSGYTCVQFAG